MSRYEEPEVIRKGGFFGKFIAVLLGFLLGIIATIAAIAGAGYYIYTQMTVKDGIDTANNFGAGIGDYSQYITEEYANKTVQELVADITEISRELGNGTGTLRSFADISPQIEKTAETLRKNLAEYGIEMQTDAFLDTPVSEMGDFLQNTLKTTEIGTLLDNTGNLEESNANYELLMRLCYGTENTHYILDESKTVVMLQKQIAAANATAYDERGDALTGTLSETADGYTYEENGTVWHLTEKSGKTLTVKDETGAETEAEYYLVTDGAGEAVYYAPLNIGDVMNGNAMTAIEKEIRIGDLLSDTDGSLLLSTIADWTLADFNKQSKIDSLTIGNIIEIDESSTQILQSIKDTPIGDLSGKIDELTLGDVIDIDENDEDTAHILIKLKDSKISELSDSINNLELGDVIKIDESSTQILQSLQSSKINELSEAIDKLTLGEVIDIDESSTQLLQTLKDRNINELSEAIDELTLGEVIDIDESSTQILQSLKDSKINDLSASIELLTLVEILGEESVEGNTILKHLKNSTINTLADDMEELTIQQVFAEKVYRTEETESGIYYIDAAGALLYRTDEEGTDAQKAARVLTGSWKYLLTDKETGLEKNYKITEIDGLVSNMTANIQKSTMDDLYADGIVELKDETFLDSKITYVFEHTYEHTASDGSVYEQTIFIDEIDEYKNEDGTTKLRVGELTIEELIDYVTQVVRLFPTD